MDFQTRPVSATGAPAAPETPLEPTPFAGAPLPPVSRWQKVKNFYFANKWYVWAIVLGVAIIGVLAFFAFHSGTSSPGGEANVKVTIDAPETAPSGSQMVYKFIIDNQDPAKLVNMELELVYPDGFTYLSSTPNAQNLSGSVFSIPDLSSGQNAVVIVKVNAQGSINDDKHLVARLHYRYSNFNSEFIKESEHTVRLLASDVVMELTGPDTTTSTQPVTYKLRYKNESDHDIVNARIQLTYPEGFTYGTATPQPNLGQNIWNIGSLKQNEEGTIEFGGTFATARPGQRALFESEFLVLDDQGNYYSQASTTFTTTISSTPLLVTQEVQGADNDIVNPGTTLTFVIHYQNNSQVAATGVSVVASVDSKAVDLSSLKAEGGAEVNNNTVTWNTASVSNFEHLNPNESGTVQYSVKLNNPATKDSSKNITVTSAVKIKSNEYSTYLPGNSISLKISSPSDLSSGVTVVSGPNPPQSGATTVYQVTLNLRNSNNDFTDGLLTGFVASNLSGFDKSTVTVSEASLVSYDPSTGKMTWKVGTLAAHTGDFNPTRRLSFQVKVVPSSSQSGNNFALFKTIKFSAKDSFTGQIINLDTEDITSGQVQQ
jgi:uncharacterized repeat protein (TIGR01451 family)